MANLTAGLERETENLAHLIDMLIFSRTESSRLQALNRSDHGLIFKVQ